MLGAYRPVADAVLDMVVANSNVPRPFGCTARVSDGFCAGIVHSHQRESTSVTGEFPLELSKPHHVVCCTAEGNIFCGGSAGYYSFDPAGTPRYWVGSKQDHVSIGR